MRIALMHNPSAGSEDHSADELIEQIRRAGHEVVAHFSKVADLSATALQRQNCDLVVVAGGDGTVDEAALALAGSGLPLTILPLGTANNIARSFGLMREERELIAAWGSGAIRALDIGALTIGGASERFVEAVGFGVFPDVMKDAKSLPEPGPGDALERDRQLFKAQVEDARLVSYDILIDGEDVSGIYLLVEVMKVPLLGPNLPLASRCEPGDGKLHVVLVDDERRRVLLDSIEDVRRGQPPRTAVPVRSGSRVTISSEESRYHRDGKVYPCAPRASFDLSVQPGDVRVLTVSR